MNLNKTTIFLDNKWITMHFFLNAFYCRTPFGSAQPRSTGASPTVSSGVSSNFGPNMGADAIADPDNNQYPNTPQLGK